MNAERLHAIVKVLKEELNEKNLVGRMQSLVQALRAVVQQSNASNQNNLAAILNDMKDLTRDSPIDRFSPTWKQLLKEIGGDDLFGAPLQLQIEASIANNQLTPSVAADALNEIYLRMEAFSKAVMEASASLKTLRIGDERLERGVRGWNTYSAPRGRKSPTFSCRRT